MTQYSVTLDLTQLVAAKVALSDMAQKALGHIREVRKLEADRKVKHDLIRIWVKTAREARSAYQQIETTAYPRNK